MNELVQNFTQVYVLTYNDKINKFDAKNQIITNLGNPESDLDVINLLTMKNYIFKNISIEIDKIKDNINKIYNLLNYTDIDSLYFSKFNLEDDLKEKIVYFKNIIEKYTVLIQEFMFKYNSLEKKTTLLEFNKIHMENQIESLQEQIIELKKKISEDKKLQNDFTDNKSENYNLLKKLYFELKGYLDLFYNNAKINFEKVNIDINFLNDKNIVCTNSLSTNKKNIEEMKLDLNNLQNSLNYIKKDINNKDMFDNCLYKVKIINQMKSPISVSNLDKYIIKNFVNSNLYENVSLCKIKYNVEYYDVNDLIIKKYLFNDMIELIINGNIIHLKNLPEYDINIKNLVKETDFIDKLTIPNIFDNTENIKYIIINISLIFKFSLF